MSNFNGNSNGHHSNGASNGLVRLNGNGHKPNAPIVTDHDPASSAGSALLWDGLPPVVTRALAQPLDLAIVSQRKGRAGMIYHYLEGHTVIDQANRIFGHGGWGYELVSDVTLRQMETVDSRTGEVKASSAYSAPVRVTVAGAPSRTDVGFHAVAEETHEGHDTALKGAVTDGMKRALRSFGVQFGNGLYGDQVDWSGEPRPERVPVQAATKPEKVQPNRSEESQVQMLRERLMELGTAQGFDEKQVQEAVEARTGRNLDQLTAAELAPLVKAAANKLNKIRQSRAS